ncbi:MAG TPA: AzlC family ABC transporter permease [Mycobacteriales bacterium]|nr:AzlC family ABC transporter permease [Mycobacteriales bacterium]
MRDRRAVLRDSLGLGIAVGAYGLSFGALSAAAGLSVLQTCVLSLAGFTGGSQFTYVGIVGAGGATGSAVGSALLLGLRNVLYGVRVRPLLGLDGWRRAGAAHLVIDESTGMAIAQPADQPELARTAFWATGLSIFVLWNLATLGGALLGNAVDPRTLGLDGAEPAAFLVLLWGRLAAPGGRRVAALAAAIAIVAGVTLPAGLAVPIAAVAVIAGGRREPASGPDHAARGPRGDDA